MSEQTVYVVMEYDYSATDIYAVFSTELKAQEYLELWNKVHGSYKDFTIKPMTLDDFANLRDEEHIYNVRMYCNSGTIIASTCDISQYDPELTNLVLDGLNNKTVIPHSSKSVGLDWGTYVRARDIEYAKKIGVDRIAQFRAEQIDEGADSFWMASGKVGE